MLSVNMLRVLKIINVGLFIYNKSINKIIIITFSYYVGPRGAARRQTDRQTDRQTGNFIKIVQSMQLQCHSIAIQRRPVLRPERSLPHRPPTRIIIIIYKLTVLSIMPF